MQPWSKMHFFLQAKFHMFPLVAGEHLKDQKETRATPQAASDVAKLLSTNPPQLSVAHRQGS